MLMRRTLQQSDISRSPYTIFLLRACSMAEIMIYTSSSILLAADGAALQYNSRPTWFAGYWTMLRRCTF